MIDLIAAKRASKLGFFLFFFFSICGPLLSGCTVLGSAESGFDSGRADRIYRLSTQEALDYASAVLAEVLPGQKILPLKKPRVGLLVHQTHQSGYAKYARFRETSYIYELDLIRLEGKTSQGDKVSGYIYTIKGNGDLKGGPEKVAQIDQYVEEAFEQSGSAVAVLSAHPVGPETPKRFRSKPPVAKPAPPTPAAAPPARVSSSPSPSEMPKGQQPPVTAVPMKGNKGSDAEEDAFSKLKKLKELLDEGVITEEEFQVKKKELLDRI